jgi:hypothetical protein
MPRNMAEMNGDRVAKTCWMFMACSALSLGLIQGSAGDEFDLYTGRKRSNVSTATSAAEAARIRSLQEAVRQQQDSVQKSGGEQARPSESDFRRALFKQSAKNAASASPSAQSQPASSQTKPAAADKPDRSQPTRSDE